VNELACVLGQQQRSSPGEVGSLRSGRCCPPLTGGARTKQQAPTPNVGSSSRAASSPRILSAGVVTQRKSSHANVVARRCKYACTRMRHGYLLTVYYLQLYVLNEAVTQEY